MLNRDVHKDIIDAALDYTTFATLCYQHRLPLYSEEEYHQLRNEEYVDEKPPAPKGCCGGGRVL